MIYNIQCNLCEHRDYLICSVLTGLSEDMKLTGNMPNHEDKKDPGMESNLIYRFFSLEII